MAAPTEVWIGFFLCFCLNAIVFVLGDDEFDGLSTFQLEHSFDRDGETFTRRGTITVRSLKSGNAHFSREAPLSLEERQKLKALAVADDLYRIRILSKTMSSSTSDPSANYVSSFTKACAIYESHLSDVVTVNMDLSGNLLGVSISTPVAFCSGEEVSDSEIAHFNTTVEVVQTAVGPAPETQTYIQKLEEEKAQKAKGQQQDNKSFIAKYWMYIVPLVIVMMFMSNADPNQQGGGGGR